MIQKVNERISVLFTEEGFSKSNSLLIDDKICVMIDSGPGAVINEIRPERVDILLNSHCHLDHIWDNDRFVNAEISTHPEEMENLKDFRKIVPVVKWSKLMGGEPDIYLNEILSVKESFRDEWRVDRTVNDGQVVSAGSTTIRILHTPGHTSGHLSFFIPEEDLLFCGDICLSKVGPWYGDDVTPVDEFIRSIDMIIDMKPAKVVSGHNREIISENIKEIFEEYRDRIFFREKKILGELKGGRPLSIDEMASMCLIYPEHPSVFVLYWEKSMLLKHLQRLINNGMVLDTGDGKYAAL